MVGVIKVIFCHSPQKYTIHSPQDHYKTLEETGFIGGGTVNQNGTMLGAVCHPSRYSYCVYGVHMGSMTVTMHKQIHIVDVLIS